MSRFSALALGFLGASFVVACGGDSSTDCCDGSAACDSGQWHVVTKQDPCIGPEETVSDTCMVMDGPTEPIEELIAEAEFPEGCEPVLDDGVLTIDCQVEMPLDSLFATLVDSVGVDPFPGVDFSDCMGSFSMSGGGTYSDNRFDYEFMTWADCLGDCSPEALFLVCLPLESFAGAETCPTVVTMTGRLR